MVVLFKPHRRWWRRLRWHRRHRRHILAPRDLTEKPVIIVKLSKQQPLLPFPAPRLAFQAFKGLVVAAAQVIVLIGKEKINIFSNHQMALYFLKSRQMAARFFKISWNAMATTCLKILSNGNKI